LSEITYHQRFVFDRIIANNEMFARLNNDMKGRASFITAASTAIVGIITAARFLPSSSTNQGFEFILLALVCLCSVGIYWFAALLWKSGNTALTGTSNMDVLYDSYISKEPDELRDLYGRTTFGQTCLLARRLSERGVRFVQVYYVSDKNKQPWDTHSNNNSQHEKLCADSDRATAALLTDLKARGLLEETLVVWSGEFGRLPTAELAGSQPPGRDHGPSGFSLWMAGGGLKRGFVYGGTDEIGHRAAENPVSVHDFHATVLHLLGLDHHDLVYIQPSGRRDRITDDHPVRIVHEIMA
jgi:uncharacterized protein (DUF1501 family)